MNKPLVVTKVQERGKQEVQVFRNPGLAPLVQKQLLPVTSYSSFQGILGLMETKEINNAVWIKEGTWMRAQGMDKREMNHGGAAQSLAGEPSWKVRLSSGAPHLSYNGDA
ncbi:unnamed protein product [Eretmochelys imbricata]